MNTNSITFQNIKEDLHLERSLYKIQYNLFEFWQEIKESRKRTKLSMALIFIDLQVAYDWVNRSILLNLLKEGQIPGKIIEIIKIMMLNSSVTIDEVSEWKTSRGLIQGSWLSPILFNFYINPLLKKLESNNIWFRAYADDIVLEVETKKIDNKLSKILEWWKLFEIKLNPHKSGIMRILNKSGKVKGIKNAANIPEVGKYKYLGITINQSLNFKDIIELISKKTKYMKYQLRKNKTYMIVTQIKKNSLEINIHSNNFLCMHISFHKT